MGIPITDANNNCQVDRQSICRQSLPTIIKEVIMHMIATSGVAVGSEIKNTITGMAIIGDPKPKVAWHKVLTNAMIAMINGTGILFNISSALLRRYN